MKTAGLGVWHSFPHERETHAVLVMKKFWLLCVELFGIMKGFVQRDLPVVSETEE